MCLLKDDVFITIAEDVKTISSKTLIYFYKFVNLKILNMSRFYNK